MTAVLLVGTGGFVGSVLRYLIGRWVVSTIDNPWLPYGTLAVNVLGCLVIGILGGLAETRGILNPETRALIVVGLLGGFTTFSSFGYETVALVRAGELAAGVLNVGLQVSLCLGSVWAGYSLSRVV